MRAWSWALLLAALTAASVMSADELPLPPGHERWIVVLKGSESHDAPAAVAELVTAASGRVESTLPSRLVIAAPPSVLERLLAHAAVKYVQPAAIGVPDTSPEAASLTADRNAPIQTNALTWTSGEYRYDGAGNIAAIGTSGAPGTQGYRTYGYDAVSRLTKAQIGATPAATHEYSYDVYGNRSGYALNQQWVTVPASPATNRLTDAGYDAAGNQLSRGATAATYDGFGMMTSYRFDAVNSETFVYTPNDERIGVLRGTEWTWSLRDASGKVLRQYRSSSTTPAAAWLWVEDFVYRDGLLLGSERVGEEGGRRHYHLDHLGSPRLVTGASGSILSEHDFLPFGEERTPIRQHQTKGFDREEPHRFTGHERDFDRVAPNDSSSYVDYMHARFYGATAGRFLSVDPGKDWDPAQPQSWNMYAYTRNNPINRTDPNGRQSVEQICKYRPCGAIATPIAEEARQDSAAAVEAVTALKPGTSTEEKVIGGSILTVIIAKYVAPFIIPGESAATQPVKATVQANKVAGDAFRDAVASELRAAGRQVTTEVVKKTPFGPRVIDVEVADNTGRVLGGVEAKVGSSPYKASQRAKDTWLKLFENYTVNLIRLKF